MSAKGAGPMAGAAGAAGGAGGAGGASRAGGAGGTAGAAGGAGGGGAGARGSASGSPWSDMAWRALWLLVCTMVLLEVDPVHASAVELRAVLRER